MADPPLPPPVAPPTGPEGRAAYSPEQQAGIIRNFLFASRMASSMDLDNLFSHSGFKLFLDQFVREAGGPSDPVEVMLLQQLALMHHRIADLHGRAGQATDVERVEAYTAAATRLTAEFRRSAVALASYRSSPPARRTPEGSPANGEENV